MADQPEPTYRFWGHKRPENTHRDPIRAEVSPRTDGATATIRIYDPIDSYGDFWGVSAKEFAKALDDLPDDVDTIELHINSPGGEVSDAIAIRNSLMNHKAKVNVTVDGLAASAASFIAVAGDTLTMGRNSQLMIHDAAGLVIGNAQDMASFGHVLDQFSDNIASMYADKAGGTPESWRDVMRAETWYSADEAVAAGLADRVAPKKAATTEPTNRFDLTVFAHAGREHAPAPAMPAPRASQTPAAEPVNPPNPEEADAMSDALIKGLRERLGVAADADLDENGLLAALDEALDETAAPVAKVVEKVVAAKLPDGVVTVEASVLASLQADAAAGREARDVQVSERREQLVTAAIRDGRIPPARRDAWLDQLAADPGAETVLAGLAPGLVPVAAIGEPGTPEALSSDITDAEADAFSAALGLPIGALRG